jgi:hypothetical protein
MLVQNRLDVFLNQRFEQLRLLLPAFAMGLLSSSIFRDPLVAVSMFFKYEGVRLALSITLVET